jgi:hypothetical protein
MTFEDIWFWGVAVAYVVVWIASFVSFFRMPSEAWSSNLERYLTLSWLVFWGVIGAAVWFFGVRPILRERLATLERDSVSAQTEAWRIKHVA